MIEAIKQFLLCLHFSLDQGFYLYEGFPLTRFNGASAFGSTCDLMALIFFFFFYITSLFSPFGLHSNKESNLNLSCS